MHFPIDGAFRIGYGFGPRGNIGVPGASTNHEAIDIVRPHGPLPVGTPVHAILDGKVIQAGNSHGGAGYTVLTEHRIGRARYRVRSNHFSRWLVRAGQKIKGGQVIGESGGVPGTAGAGASGGAHYHCGIYKRVLLRWKPIDPGPFFGLGSTRGIGSTRGSVTYPAFAGGDATPFEEDDMPTAEEVALAVWNMNVNYASGPKPAIQVLADIPTSVWSVPVNRSSGPVKVIQEVADAKSLAIAQQGQIAALAELLAKVSAPGGSTLTAADIEQAVERATRNALSGLTLTAVIDEE